MESTPSGYLSIAEKQNRYRGNVKLSSTNSANPAQECPEPTTAPTRSALLKAALEYASRGLPVFPCKPGEKRPCWAKGVLENGHLDATTDPQRITAWWNRWPEANIGVPTGGRSGWLVVDQDHPAALDDLEEEHGALPATRTHGTGNGGLQFLLKYPAGSGIRNSAGKLAEHLDIRGEGGYVVVPPSRTTRPYEVLDELPLVDPPAWLLEALTTPKTTPAGDEAGQGGRRASAPVGIPDGPIPDGRRHQALTSIAGRLHDGTRDLAQLTADLEAVNMARCVPPIGEDDPSEAGNVAKTAESIFRCKPCKPQGKRAPEEVQGALLAFEQKIGATTWSGKAYFRLSLLKSYVMLARKHGELRENGVAVSVSNSQAALHNGCSDRAVRRNNARLVEASLIASDNGDRAPTDSGTIVLLIPLSGHLDNPTGPGCVLTYTHQGAHRGEGEKKQPAARGGGLGQNAAPAAWSATRARHGKPIFDAGELVDFLGRMGPRAEQAVDLLEGAGGRLLPEVLAGALGIKRTRNMYASVWLSRLLDAGVVEWDDEGYLSLTDGWLAAWDRRRVEDEEEMDRERDRERYRRMSEAWAARVAEHAENVHQKRLDRMAHACHDGEPPPGADGFIYELEPVEDAADAPVPIPVVAEASPEAVEVLEVPERTGDGPSELSRALGEWLGRHPDDHPERKPPGEFAMQLSWLAGTLWAYDLVGEKPGESAVAVALGELERARMGAAA